MSPLQIIKLAGPYFFTRQCLFSRVEGVVVQNGKPIAGAEVERVHDWSWRKPISKTITTDVEGRFLFPPVKTYSFLALVIPHEPVISQSILIRHGDAEHEAWLFSKHDYDENGELDGKRINLVCDLGAEATFEGKEFYGIATLAE